MSSKPVKDAIEALYKPVESLVKTLAGPAAEEIGLSFRDSMQAWRFKRQVRLFKRVKEICAEAGIKPQAVKLSLLFDIVDRATLEESDDLQDRWANLLTNAADPNYEGLISTAFPEILRQLSGEEARLLDGFYFLTKDYDSPVNMKLDKGQYTAHDSRYQFVRSPEDVKRFEKQMELCISAIYVDNLKRLGLIDELLEQWPSGYPSSFPSELRKEAGGSEWRLTSLGRVFIQACQAPKKHGSQKAAGQGPIQ